MNRFIRVSSQVFIGISALAFLSVGLMAFWSPQAVMDLVQVKLTNNDAFSSIRGVYGGVGLTLAISLVYLMRTDAPKALLFLAFIWGFYMFSRVTTIFVEGELGGFGTQWLVIEFFFCMVAVGLISLQPRLQLKTPS